MNLRKHWSLAYLLYYFCVLSYWVLSLIIISDLLAPVYFTVLGVNTYNIGSAIIQLSGRLITLSLLWIFFHQLSIILLPIAKGQPFKKETPIKLKVIGWAILLFSVLDPLFYSLIYNDSGSAFNEYLSLFTEYFNPLFILFAFFTFVLSYVFKEGTRIYEEQKLTV